MQFIVVAAPVGREKDKKRKGEQRPCLALASEGFPDQHKGDPFSQQGGRSVQNLFWRSGSIKRLSWQSADISGDSQSAV